MSQEDNVGSDAETAGESGADEPLTFDPSERFANPVDHLGRTAAEAAALRKTEREHRCPDCRHALLLRAGGTLPAHFAHAPGREDRSCVGSHETPWHVAAKRAAAARPGWAEEYRHGQWRYDAYNAGSGEVFEAVHTLSERYLAKQQYLRGVGCPAVWLFDSNGHFCRRGDDLRLDVYRAVTRGRLFCGDMLSPAAAALVDELGRANCFLYYLGLAWRCVGGDEWECCHRLDPIQRLCMGSAGITRIYLDFSASGAFADRRTWFRDRFLVPTAWHEVSPERLRESIVSRQAQLIESQRRSAAARAARNRARQRRECDRATAAEVVGRSVPVCQAGGALTAVQVAAMNELLRQSIGGVTREAAPALAMPGVVDDEPAAQGGYYLEGL